MGVIRLEISCLHYHLNEAPQQLEAVEDDNCATDDVDDTQCLVGELGTEQGNDGGNPGEPEHRSGSESSYEEEVHTVRQGCFECTQHHGTVNQCLWVKPGYHAGGGDYLQYRDIHFRTGIHGIVGPDQPLANPDNDDTSDEQNGFFQQRKGCHDSADAEEACHTQSYVKEDDDEGGQVDPAFWLGQCGIDYKKVLKSDGGHVGQSHGQPLQINVHK